MPTDLDHVIASQVRKLRTAQGLTLEALASQSGMPIETLSRIERKRIALCSQMKGPRFARFPVSPLDLGSLSSLC